MERGVLIASLLLPLLKAAQCDDPLVSEPSSRTIIAFEVPPQYFTDLFILGGYTGGNESRCTGGILNDPCSIPIVHIKPEVVPAAYDHWSEGDRYFDMEGAEPGQGEHEGENAYGTPLRNVDNELAREILHFKDSPERDTATFWLVELEMDCNETNGYFEVEAVVRTRSRKMMYESRKKFIDTLNKMEKGKNFRTPMHGKPVSFSPALDKERHNNLNGPQKRSTKLRPSFGKQCVGTVHIDLPYETERHIGLCGRANIFRYKTHYCEINEV